MRSSKTLVLYLLALAISGCSSLDGDDVAVEGTDTPAVVDLVAAAVDIDCVCGEPSADLHGCHCADCVEGTGNPENPLCTCGPLTVAPAREGNTRLASNGAGDLASLEPQVLMDATGKKVRGRILEDDGERITIAIETPGGAKGRQTLNYAQLDPRTAYRLHLGRVALDDAPAQFELGKFAASAGLYDAALRHYLQAADADPGLFEQVDSALEDLRETAAEAQVKKARGALKKGDLDRAQGLLSDALAEFPGTRSATEAELLLADLGERILEKRRAEAALADEKLAKRLAPSQERYEKALGHMQSALSASNSTSQAVQRHERAEAEFDNARRRLDNLRRKYADDAALVEHVDGLFAELDVDYIRNELHLASRQLQRGSYSSAHHAVNRVLEVDPAHQEALNLRVRISEAERYEGWGYGDRWWRRRWVGGGWARPGWGRSGGGRIIRVGGVRVRSR